MTFNGWANKALEFYQGLEADNSKSYWTAHKAVYESDVRDPLIELLAELEPEFGPGRTYRPLRDTRFSADKTPYKTAACLTLDYGAVVQISGQGLSVGTGYQSLAPDQLERYRAGVLDDKIGGQLREVVDALAEQDIALSPGQQLKGAPRGMPADHVRVDLLRKKDLFTFDDYPVEPWLHTAAAREPIVEYLRVSRPLSAWLADHVGPTTSAGRPRYGERTG